MNDPKNKDPFEKWNDPMYRDDPSQPWNDPFKRNESWACWNQLDGQGEYRDECDH